VSSDVGPFRIQLPQVCEHVSRRHRKVIEEGSSVISRQISIAWCCEENKTPPAFANGVEC
jgi:hypothetical protein